MPPVPLRVVSIEPAAQGFLVMVNQKPIKTPLGIHVIAPTRKLAEKIGEEWQTAPARPDPSSLPITALHVTCLDRVAPNRLVIIDALGKFLATDLLCFRTPHPPALNVRQEEILTPMLRACVDIVGVELKTTTDLSPVVHPPIAATKLMDILNQLSDAELTTLQVCAAATGSVLMALLLVQQKITEDQAVVACFLDEDYFEGLADPTHDNPDPLQARQRKVLHTEINQALSYLSLSTFK